MAACACEKKVISLAGDILLRNGSEAYAAVAAESFNPQIVFGNLYSFISESDLFFFNQEGAVTNHTEPRDSYLPIVFYTRGGPEIIPFLSKLHANTVASLANNHIADFSHAGMQDTKDFLQRAGIQTIGMGSLTDMAQPLVVTLSTLRISFLAFTDLLPSSYYAAEGTSGVFRLSEKNLIEAITAARIQSDLVIVSLHTIAEISAPFREDPDHTQTRFAHIAADAGAHLVVGHQPHGLQYVEKRSGAHIFHSLGSLVYNPKASTLFKKGHPLHNGTQFFGGSILQMYACKHGLAVRDWIPTICVFEEGRLRVTRASPTARLKAWSYLLLK